MMQFVEKTICAVFGSRGISLIIKLHPRDKNMRAYKKKIADLRSKHLNIRIYLCQSEDIFRLIELSDVILTVGSSVAIDSLRMEKQVCLLDFFDYYEEMYSYLDPVISRVKSEEALRKYLSQERTGRGHRSATNVIDGFFQKKGDNAARELVRFIVSKIDAPSVEESVISD
jgi:capsule polysaccharide modification protein KpsS